MTHLSGNAARSGNPAIEKIGRITAIKRYFSKPERPVTTAELKELTNDEREYLAVGAAKELGVEIDRTASL